MQQNDYYRLLIYFFIIFHVNSLADAFLLKTFLFQIASRCFHTLKQILTLCFWCNINSTVHNTIIIKTVLNYT